MATINQRAVEQIAADQPHTIWVAGHLYGSHGNRHSVFQASSFLANMDLFRDSGAKAMVLLGDNYRRADSVQLDQFQRTMEKFPFPVFNAVGNHDKSQSKLYRDRFGEQTFGIVRIGSSQLIILDTELDRGAISGEQLRKLLQWLRQASEDEQIENVFVFCHQLVWCVNHPKLSSISRYINSNKHLRDGWHREVGPDLERLAKRKPVFVFSGDVGATWSYSTFYWQDSELPLHYLATGLGDTLRDAVLRVDVAADGAAQVTAVSMTGEQLSSVDKYGPEFWSEYFARQRQLQESARTQSIASPPKGSDSLASQSNRWSPATMLVLSVIGISTLWGAFRLTEIGWQRFKTVRIKYYSSNRRGE